MNDEKSLSRTRDEMMIRSWRLGKILAELKDEIGHGRWLFWLGGNFPEISERSARCAMAFYWANENWKRTKSAKFCGFDDESVPKFMFGYVPEKERPEFPGDRKDAPNAHYLTFVNNFAKWDRQIQIGQAQMPPIDILRHELSQCHGVLRYSRQEHSYAILRIAKNPRNLPICVRVKFVRRLPRAPPGPLPAGVNRDQGFRRKTEV